MVSKTVLNAGTAGVLVAFVGGVYVYTMKAVSKDGIEEVSIRFCYRLLTAGRALSVKRGESALTRIPFAFESRALLATRPRTRRSRSSPRRSERAELRRG